MITNERKWFVCFVRWPMIHWTMRWVVRQNPYYGHVVLLSPIGSSRWIFWQWGFDGLFVEPVGEMKASRIFTMATEVIEYDRRAPCPHSTLHSLLPNTCMTLARQVLGLPAKWNFFASGWALRCELIERGGKVVLAGSGERRRA